MTLGSQDERSLGELVASMTRDMSTLVHKEIELAKAEMREEAVRAGKSAGLLGVAAAFGLPAFLMLLTACALGISYLGTSQAIGFMVMGLLVGGIALLCAAAAARKLTKMKPPERTIQTVKDDIAWARHPTVAPDPQQETIRAAQLR